MDSDVIQEIHLGFTKGRSDKVYIVRMTEECGVVCEYGRRGQRLQRIVMPVNCQTFQGCLNVFNKIVSKKEKKGYQIEKLLTRPGAPLKPDPLKPTNQPKRKPTNSCIVGW